MQEDRFGRGSTIRGSVIRSARMTFITKRRWSMAELEAAEELRALRLANGNGTAPTNPKPLSDLLKSLKPAAEPEPSFKRRDW